MTCLRAVLPLLFLAACRPAPPGAGPGDFSARAYAYNLHGAGCIGPLAPDGSACDPSAVVVPMNREQVTRLMLLAGDETSWSRPDDRCWAPTHSFLVEHQGRHTEIHLSFGCNLARFDTTSDMRLGFSDSGMRNFRDLCRSVGLPACD